MESYFWNPVIKTFLEEHPEYKIRITMSDLNDILTIHLQKGNCHYKGMIAMDDLIYSSWIECFLGMGGATIERKLRENIIVYSNNGEVGYA